MFKVYGSAASKLHKHQEAFKAKRTAKNKVIASVGNSEREIDFSWLKSAATQYKISDDIADYVVVPVPIITCDFPNKNMQEFPLEEVTQWNTEHGRMVYQTFIGKPTFVEHKNDNPLEARGIHLDATMKYIPKYDVWKIVVLLAWDRTKDPELVQEIMHNPNYGYSMGSMVPAFLESTTGRRVRPTDKRGFLDKNGRLVYHRCVGLGKGSTGGANTPVFFETSAVNKPADATAITSPDEILIRPDEMSW